MTNDFKNTTKSFRAILSLLILLAGAIGTAIGFGVKIGGDRNRIDTLEKAVVNLTSEQVLHRKRYEELERRVYAIDKNVYGIAIKLKIEQAIKTK